MKLKDFRSLPPKERALAAIAVLLDGKQAAEYLSHDAVQGLQLAEAAQYLASHPPELRMPLAGTALRTALEEMIR